MAIAPFAESESKKTTYGRLRSITNVRESTFTHSHACASRPNIDVCYPNPDSRWLHVHMHVDLVFNVLYLPSDLLIMHCISHKVLCRGVQGIESRQKMAKVRYQTLRQLKRENWLL
jgi:hypothetical protein